MGGGGGGGGGGGYLVSSKHVFITHTFILLVTGSILKWIIYFINFFPHCLSQFHRYWPAVGEQEQHGNVIVQVETETEEHFYTKREIKLTNAKVVRPSALNS